MKILRKVRPSGQGLVEYAIILLITALVVIVILELLSPAIGEVFSQLLSDMPKERVMVAQYCPEYADLDCVDTTSVVNDDFLNCPRELVMLDQRYLLNEDSCSFYYRFVGEDK